MPKQSHFEKDLQNKQRKLQAEIEARAALQKKVLERKHALTQSLKRAAQGVQGNPVYSVRRDIILVDTPSWAQWILEVGKIFPKEIKLNKLESLGLPDNGLGIDAGFHLLQLARKGKSVESISKTLAQLRKTLGPWKDISPYPNIKCADSELGIASFFRQLQRYFDGESWSPPLLRPHKKSFTPSKNQQAILDIIAEHPTPAKNLAAEILGSPKKESLIRSYVLRLRKVGYDIETIPGQGYKLLSQKQLG